MSKGEPIEEAAGLEFITDCMDAIRQRRYRDALTSLNDGLTKQLSSQPVANPEKLLEQFRTLLAYLDSRLGEDFGTEWELQPYEENPIDVRCSFCGKTEPEVKKIIAGPGVFICNECIQICADTLAKE